MNRARRIFTSRALLGVLVVVAVVNVAVFAVERWYVLPLHVPSASMEPALREGERILVKRTHASPADLARQLDRGDVLVFRAPEAGEPLTVKRVIGLPGETIQAKDGVIAIDDEKILVEQWLPESERDIGTPAADSVDIPLTRLGDDEVYLLGDNRDNSIDSRVYGPVSLDDVVGTVLVRYWPPSRYGKVDWA
ncbi:MAG: signal peptidase I [Thermoleophilia bacterium]|nr:signal peptidase I [Thermoleophilia bacterium]